MRDRETTIRSRELGEGLRTAMLGAGLSSKQAGHKLGWSDSRVSRLLSGKRGGSEIDVAAEFNFFVHEFALRLPASSRGVMSEQLHHLLRLSVRPYLSLRVVPASAGVHAGIAGAFKVMEFAEFRPIVYLDSETASIFLEEPAEIATYRRSLSALADTALDEGQSRELIAAIAVEQYADPEDNDAPP